MEHPPRCSCLHLNVLGVMGDTEQAMPMKFNGAT